MTADDDQAAAELRAFWRAPADAADASDELPPGLRPHFVAVRLPGFLAARCRACPVYFRIENPPPRLVLAEMVRHHQEHQRAAAVLLAVKMRGPSPPPPPWGAHP